MSVVGYIKHELSIQGRSFIKDWAELTAEDKEQLRKYAIEEMTVLGIKVG